MNTNLSRFLNSSFTSFIFEQPIELLTTKDKDTTLNRVVKMGAGCVVFSAAALTATIETIARTIFTALAKLIHFFMPKDSEITKNFEKNVLSPLFTGLHSNALTIGRAALKIGSNFLGEKPRKKIETKLDNAFYNAFESIHSSSAYKNIYNLHINGITQNTLSNTKTPTTHSTQ